MKKIAKIIIWFFVIIQVAGILLFVISEIVKGCSSNKDIDYTETSDDEIWNDEKDVDSIINFSRESLRKAVKKYDKLNKGTLTLSSGSVIIFGSNGYGCTSEVPQEVKDKLKEINNARENIDDICLTEGGHFAIVYNKGNSWFGTLSDELKEELRSLPNDAKIKSITIDDNNNYIAIIQNGNITKILASSNEYKSFANSLKNKLGKPVSATLIKDGALFCFENGVDYFGTIPKNVADKLNEIDFTPEYVRLDYRGNYIFSMNTGRAKYKMSDTGTAWDNETVTKDFNPDNIPSEGNIDDNQPNDDESNTKKSKKTSTQYVAPVHTPTQHPITCGVCGGSGRCTTCGGGGISYVGSEHICGACGGRGRCATCGGSGISGYTYY